jgi:hypothetical protein
MPRLRPLRARAAAPASAQQRQQAPSSAINGASFIMARSGTRHAHDGARHRQVTVYEGHMSVICATRPELERPKDRS